MCVNCYLYLGTQNNEEWISRYMDHISEPPCLGVGYCNYPVYAVYDAYACEGCDAFKRGDFSFYGYYDYSDKNDPKWIRLEPWQVEELKLKKLSS